MCNGLRNWLVDTKIVFESVDDMKETLMKLIEKVEGVLNEIFAEKD